jgi:hypothetical protein
MAYGGETGLHYLESQKNQSGTEKEISDIDQSSFPAEKLADYAKEYGGQGEKGYFKGNELDYQGRADTGAEKDRQGLIEGYQAGIHKTYYQDGGGTAGLEQRREATPRKGGGETIAGGFFKKFS